MNVGDIVHDRIAGPGLLWTVEDIRGQRVRLRRHRDGGVLEGSLGRLSRQFVTAKEPARMENICNIHHRVLVCPQCEAKPTSPAKAAAARANGAKGGRPVHPFTVTVLGERMAPSRLRRKFRTAKDAVDAGATYIRRTYPRVLWGTFQIAVVDSTTCAVELTRVT